MSFTKKINVNDGSGRQFEDVTTSEMVYDATPQLGSFNPVTSDGVARAISGASGEVPVINPGDDGKVLTVVDGAAAWDVAQGTEYTAGTGIAISNENVISCTVQGPSAGDGINIESNVISVNHDETLTEVGGPQPVTPDLAYASSNYSGRSEAWHWYAYSFEDSTLYGDASFNLPHDKEFSNSDYYGKQVVAVISKPGDPSKFVVGSLKDSEGNQVFLDSIGKLPAGTYYAWPSGTGVYHSGGGAYSADDVIVDDKVIFSIGFRDQSTGTLMTNPDATGPAYDGVPMQLWDFADTYVPGPELDTPIEPGPDAEWNWPSGDPITQSTGSATKQLSVANPVPSVDGHTGEFLKAGSNGPEWVAQTEVEYANQELKVLPPNGAPLLIIDTSNATPVTDTEPYSEGVMDYSSSELIVAFSGALGTKDLASCTLSIVSDIDATGITLGNLEFNYYRINHGDDSYIEEPISPMVVTGATSASPSKILEGDYVVPIVPNPDPSYPDLCVKITYSGSPDQADLDAFVNLLSSSVWPWGVYGDKRVATGYGIKPAVLPDITGQAGKVLAVNAGETGTEWSTVGRTAGDGIKIENNTVSAYHGETLVDKALPLAFNQGAEKRNAFIGAGTWQWYTALKVEFGNIDPNSTLLKIFIKDSGSSQDVSLAMPYTSVDPDLGGKKVKLVFANPDNPSNYIEAVSASNVEITQGSGAQGSYTAKVSVPAVLIDSNFQNGFNWHGLTLADIQGADGSTLMYAVACASDGTLITTGSYGPTDNLWTVGFGNGYLPSATTYALVTLPSNPVGFDVKNPVPDISGVEVGSVLTRGNSGMEWVAGGVPSYLEITTGTASIGRDNSVVTSTADITSIIVGANVKSAIVQWKVNSTTTLPTVTSGGSPLGASVNNPASLTVGHVVQVSILNGTWVCAEFA